MARQRPTRTLSDAYMKTRPVSTDAKPSRVSLIVDGIKYRAGQDPVRVCPAGMTPQRNS